METNKINLTSLAQHFSDEAEAWKLIESIRWPECPVCPHCGNADKAYFMGNRKTKAGKVSPRRVWKCAVCRRQFSALVGTIFEDTHIPLSK